MKIAMDAPVSDDWIRIPGDVAGIPLWKWREGGVYVAAHDMDQLLFLGVALALFDEMSALEFHNFVSSRPGIRHYAARFVDGTDLSLE